MTGKAKNLADVFLKDLISWYTFKAFGYILSTSKLLLSTIKPLTSLWSDRRQTLDQGAMLQAPARAPAIYNFGVLATSMEC